MRVLKHMRIAIRYFKNLLVSWMKRMEVNFYFRAFDSRNTNDIRVSNIVNIATIRSRFPPGAEDQDFLDSKLQYFVEVEGDLFGGS